jgi:Spy/CpxP family protein refolding chaperone
MMGRMIADKAKRMKPARAGMAGFALSLLLGMAAQAEPGPGPEKHGGPGDHGGPGASETGGMEMLNLRMLKELHLNADQEKKFKDAKLAAQKKKIQLHADKATLELDLKTVLGTFPVNKPEALKLAEKVADVDKRMTLLRVETMTQVLSGLTADQFAKLQVIQAEWMEKRRTWREEMRKERGDRHDDGKSEDGRHGKGH